MTPQADAPLTLPTEKARHVAELARALKRIPWQLGTEYGSPWLATQLYDHGIRVQLPNPDQEGDRHE